MLSRNQPHLIIPQPIRGLETGSFAHDTIIRRLPEIARRVIQENNLSAESTWRINELADEMPLGTIRPLTDIPPADGSFWNTWIIPHLEKNWLEVPWFFAEEYFYRRVLEAIGYFEDGPHQGLDPYLYQKEKGLLSSWKSVEELCTQVKTWEIEKIPLPLQISRMLLLDVWGNRSDMSIWSADDQTQALGKVQNGQDGLLLNELEEFTTFLHQAGDRLGRVDILVDNAGFELFCDLLLVDILLKNEIASSIHLHLKPYPVFVSDAMKKDVLYTVGQITGSIQSDVHNMGLRLDEWLDGERIVLEDDRFWISPFPAWEMPDDLVATLANSDLLISKGDANYRRLLGDCHWDLTLPFSQIVSYLPSPLLALRVCKSEIVAGLSDEQIRYLNQNQPGWMTCGDFAVINFAQSQSG